MKVKIQKIKLAVVGLGYVGLPLALEFAKKTKVIGFDIENKRIKELKIGIDKNLEFKKKDLKNIKNLNFTNNKQDLKSANCYILTIPTPVNKLKKPNLKPLLEATKIVANNLKKGDLIIYESTVYPGCTEEQCVPILQKISGLQYNKDFFCGYSPERINPGDKKFNISNIKKITSGSTPEILNVVDSLYKKIIVAGTHRAESIKVAEAAKVIENTQRDLNIALINELSMFFSKMNISTQAVLKAAETKWNFLPFKPGLVGGHCIGVDPYYLTHKAKAIGYNPKIILAGREINDGMAKYVASQFIYKMNKKNIEIKNSKILIMGLTFKENCADTRNAGIEKVIKKLKKTGCKIDLYDPWSDRAEIKKIYNVYPKKKLNNNSYHGIILAVSHDIFKKMGFSNIINLSKKKRVIFDLKSMFNSNKIDLNL